jgi:hypothetical protein
MSKWLLLLAAVAFYIYTIFAVVATNLPHFFGGFSFAAVCAGLCIYLFHREHYK